MYITEEEAWRHDLADACHGFESLRLIRGSDNYASYCRKRGEVYYERFIPSQEEWDIRIRISMIFPDILTQEIRR